MLEGDKLFVVKIMDKFLLFVFSLASVIVTFIAILIGFRLVDNSVVKRFVNSIYESEIVQISFILSATILLFIGFRMLFISVRRTSANAPSIKQRTDFGDIQISLETVENLSLKAAGRTRGVKDLKARIRVTDAGLEIIIRTFVDGEISIPNVTEEVQRSVKTHIEEITGIPVAAVSVFVANITQTQTFKSRVE